MRVDRPYEDERILVLVFPEPFEEITVQVLGPWIREYILVGVVKFTVGRRRGPSIEYFGVFVHLDYVVEPAVEACRGRDVAHRGDAERLEAYGGEESSGTPPGMLSERVSKPCAGG
ncbi:hypothetical protein ACNO8S_10235 [Haloarcula sp. KBTZ06]|uniref:hypothetical protein n=1 Tax=Haloarcula sp. KBTZ06 TaxID=3402682 RepID=UPI003B428CFC